MDGGLATEGLRLGLWMVAVRRWQPKIETQGDSRKMVAGLTGLDPKTSQPKKEAADGDMDWANSVVGFDSWI